MIFIDEKDDWESEADRHPKTEYRYIDFINNNVVIVQFSQEKHYLTGRYIMRYVFRMSSPFLLPTFSHSIIFLCNDN